MEASKRPREENGEGNGRVNKRRSRFADATAPTDKVVPPAAPSAATAAAIAAALAARLKAQPAVPIPMPAVQPPRPPPPPLPAKAAVPAAPNGVAAAPGAAGQSEEEIAAKAARFAALQAKIQASLANSASLLRQTEGAVATVTAASAGGASPPGLVGSDAASAAAPKPERKARDMSLRLDEQGRQIDAQGRLVKMGPVQTLKVNRPKAENPYLSSAAAAGSGGAAPVDDPSMRRRQARAEKALKMVEPGTFIKEAEMKRLREERRFLRGLAEGRANAPEQLDESSSSAAAAAAAASGASAEAEAAAAAAKVPPPPPPRHAKDHLPVMEWWDEAFVDRALRERRSKGEAAPSECTTEALYSNAAVENARTYALVQHPGAAPPAPKEPPAIKVHLTAKERKRLRRQSRQEKEREKQDMISLGLMPAPEPKMKLSNFMKLLGEQAVADPSKVERLVMEQVHARQMKHEMANAARQLTPDERRAKKVKKLREDKALEQEVTVAVFRVSVPALEDPRRRFKVDKNAQQLYLSGGVLICKAVGVAAVVVEGGPKGVKAYTRLMLRRIKWESDEADMADSGDEDAAAAANNAEQQDHSDAQALGAYGASKDWLGEGGAASGSGLAPCQLVWHGAVKQRTFNSFRFQECTSVETARKVFAQRGVAHYWDLCLKSAEGGQVAVPAAGPT